MSLSDQSPIFSSLSDDPDMPELLEEFVSNLQDRIANIQALVNLDDVGELARLAHQLKGTSGSYGFMAISEAAARLEQSAQLADSASDLENEVRQLILLCQRARAAPAS